MFTKMGDKNCKVIVDNGSSINVVSFKMTKRLGLKAVLHPHMWINSTALEVKQQCFVPVDFNLYKDKIWCDVTMNVGQIILSRP